MTANQLRGGEAIIDLLAREYGVDVVFGIPGVHNIELYRGFIALVFELFRPVTNKALGSWLTVGRSSLVAQVSAY